jgi:alpha-mannosidase
MHDEAAPSFVDMVDQTTLGHRLLKEQFGVMPKTTWQIGAQSRGGTPRAAHLRLTLSLSLSLTLTLIHPLTPFPPPLPPFPPPVDPFGHSAFSGYAMSSPLSGFNGVFVARIDYQDFTQRGKNLTRETIWAPSPSLGLNAATLFGVMEWGYGPPGGFDMAEWSSDAPIMDDPTLEDYNVDQKVADFIQAATTAPYRGSDVIMTMGSDFNYENANTWFVNLDKLIHYVNANGTIQAFYSSPSIYASAKAATTPLPLKTDDFFPYADGPHSYWTGYFVSRQGLKGYIRDTSSYFQAAKQLQTFTGGAPDMSPTNPLYRLERALGVNQHHDAVSGTSKQHVSCVGGIPPQTRAPPFPRSDPPARRTHPS